MLEKTRSLKISALTRLETFFDRGPVRRGAFSLIRGMGRHRLAQTANAMAFDLFLASIPMIALAGWAFAHGLKDSPETLATLSSLVDHTPADIHLLIVRNFGRFSVGAVAPLAIVGSFWLASSAFHTQMRVIEIAVGAEKRPWWTKRLIALGCVLVALAAIGLSSFLAVVLAGGPIAVMRALDPDVPHSGARVLNWVALLVAIVTITTLLAGFYRIGIHRPGVKRRVWPGAVLAVGIGGFASYAFGYYASTLARFTMFYGSLAAVAIALAWLWIWCAALLTGAELNTQLESAERRQPPNPERHSLPPPGKRASGRPPEKFPSTRPPSL